MNNFNKTNNRYLQMKKEYLNILTPNFNQYLNILNHLILSLEINNFNMPTIIQNQIYLTLLEAKQILNTLSLDIGKTSYKQATFNNNPLSLLSCLNNLSTQLNLHAIKSPYYLLLNKTNNLILNCTNIILNYFINTKNNKK